MAWETPAAINKDTPEFKKKLLDEKINTAKENAIAQLESQAQYLKGQIVQIDEYKHQVGNPVMTESRDSYKNSYEIFYKNFKDIARL